MVLLAAFNADGIDHPHNPQLFNAGRIFAKLLHMATPLVVRKLKRYLAELSAAFFAMKSLGCPYQASTFNRNRDAHKRQP